MSIVPWPFWSNFYPLTCPSGPFVLISRRLVRWMLLEVRRHCFGLWRIKIFLSDIFWCLEFSDLCGRPFLRFCRIFDIFVGLSIWQTIHWKDSFFAIGRVHYLLWGGQALLCNWSICIALYHVTYLASSDWSVHLARSFYIHGVMTSYRGIPGVDQ